ncbi:MAG: ABC transporter ATP-binding protein [Candidatus Hydrogenedentes bacterium]|nr:ABC transporter ATP-binding protein [Candidatus Hydrogenedentota bacterium]
MSHPYAVELRDVDKTFHTRHFFSKDEETGRRPLYQKKIVHAVNHVSFGVHPGEIFGLLGRNGAGKTTTVKMISGLVKPCSGEVFVDNLPVEKKRLQILRRIGVVLEGTRTCIWPLTPLENLAYFGNLRDVKGKVLKERSHRLLDFIGLKDKKDIQVRRLSRGQKQKLAICIALITDPPVLLLDEPTTGLDVQSSRAIKDKVIEMTREQGKCVLVTTHDMGTAQELCDRIGIIKDGMLVACKPTEELLDVFSDQCFEVRLDRMPDVEPIRRIPGVAGVEPVNSEGGPGFILQTSRDETERSHALYATLGHLQSQGVLLRTVTQRHQNLEGVFLQLTATQAEQREERI